ncbi:MAG: GC-type dockerin domain-anchored protein [Planctomycetota bacterium]
MKRTIASVALAAALTGFAGAQAIDTVGVMTNETREFSFDSELEFAVGVAEVSAELSGLAFTHDFSALGETVWTVEWRAPEGGYIEVSPPSDFSDVNLDFTFLASEGATTIEFFAFADSTHFDLLPGSPAWSPIDPQGSLSGPTGLRASANMVVEQPDILPGETYRLTSASMTFVVPADFDVSFDISLLRFSVRGRATVLGAAPPADPGQWVRVVQECRADTNGDGQVTPADFNAWVLAFNNQSPECDQNGDGFCNPADFNAWILNFNSGC